ncbi:HAMP domain-containing sensor histidine kinase [Deltaproteobacteria bacterium TL4]
MDPMSPEALLQRMQELEESNSQLKKIIHLKDQLINIAIHDFRSPITNILLCANALSTRVEAQGIFKELLEDIQANCHQQMILIDTYLNAPKLEAGQLQLQLNSFDNESLRAFFQEIQASFKLSTQSKQITLSCNIQETLPPLTMDIFKIRQVLNNLIHNAIKFTPYQGRIHLEITSTNHALRVKVEDNGAGIPSEALEMIFAPFIQVGDRSWENRGAGLGLSICKALIELHGGKIWVESTPGKGCQFYFTIPA